MNNFENDYKYFVEKSEKIINSFNNYRKNHERLYFLMFINGNIDEVIYKNKHFYRCNDRRILISSLN